MATLKEPHKILIVKLHAEFFSNAEIIKFFKEEKDIELKEHQVRYYNPIDKFNNGDLADKWRDLFHAHRDHFIKKTEDNPLFHKRYRLEVIFNQMQYLIGNSANKLKMSEATRQRLIMDLNEQAEKFVGKFFERGESGGLVKTLDELSERGKLAETFNLQLNSYYGISDGD